MAIPLRMTEVTLNALSLIKPRMLMTWKLVREFQKLVTPQVSYNFHRLFVVCSLTQQLHPAAFFVLF